ncbi:hypothetical protein RF11_14816 [Thelohanellus kitauei]|uniref:Uncharacterized protein n=1 Tax=Thelohanellus kitauei TaxID=669202 RepID=A0A0C2N9W1_THEKT|nr:hypothetical protein RF11_14816 [Thelohanellus kitauei]
MCDGVIDCSDGSDEYKFCYSQNFSRTISLNHRENGHIEFSWRAKDSSLSFQVTIIDLHDESILIDEIIKEANMDVGGHVICGSYLIIVQNTINYKVQQATYQYIPPKVLTPKNLAYDPENNKLKWDAYPYPCVPRIYYVKISII